MTSLPRGALWLSAAGAALLVLGLVVLALGTTQLAPDEFGWFAHAPGEVAVGPDLWLLTGRDVMALLAATVGLGCLAAAGGYVLGRRRSAAAPTTTTGVAGT